MNNIVFKGHTIVVVPLTDKDIEVSNKLGVARTEFSKDHGRTHRHDGMESTDAHALGTMGEIAVEKWLRENSVTFTAARRLVETYREIEQDIVVSGESLGVKTLKACGIAVAFQYDSFLYPAKNQTPEAGRILPYPARLLQVAVSMEKQQAWLIGWIAGKVIRVQPTREIAGKPAHTIPHGEYADCEKLIAIFKEKSASSS